MINFQADLRYHFLLSLDYLSDCWAYGLDPEYVKCNALGDVLSVAITGDDPAIEKSLQLPGESRLFSHRQLNAGGVYLSPGRA